MFVRTMHPSNAQCSGILECDKKHHIFTPTALCDLFQTLHGDRARRDHQKGWESFFDSTHSFSYRVHGKIRPN